MDNWTRRDTDRFLLLLKECINELSEIKKELQERNEKGADDGK